MWLIQIRARRKKVAINFKKKRSEKEKRGAGQGDWEWGHGKRLGLAARRAGCVCRAKGLPTLVTAWSLLLGFQNLGKVFAIAVSVWVRPPATPHSAEGWRAMGLLGSGAFPTLHT